MYDSTNFFRGDTQDPVLKAEKRGQKGDGRKSRMEVKDRGRKNGEEKYDRPLTAAS